MQTVTVTKVQTQDRTTNQLQDNISKALQQVGNQLNQLTVIGEVKEATLTETQFQQQAGKGWIACDGRSIVGSQLNKITGQLTAPTETNKFVRIN